LLSVSSWSHSREKILVLDRELTIEPVGEGLLSFYGDEHGIRIRVNAGIRNANSRKGPSRSSIRERPGRPVEIAHPHDVFDRCHPSDRAFEKLVTNGEATGLDASSARLETFPG